MDNIYKRPDRKKLKDFSRDILDLMNVTYITSNKGAEIRFTSNTNEHEVLLYPSTGTFINNGRTFKCQDSHDEESIIENIKFCFSYHISNNIFSGSANKNSSTSKDKQDQRSILDII